MLSVSNLKVEIKIDGVYTAVVDHVSFDLNEGGTFGLVGESGCGKTVTSKALMGLLNPAITRVTADILEFDGKNLLLLNEKEWQNIRGNQISMIFQNPMTYLNPLMKCGYQIRESIMLHQKLKSKKANNIAHKLLEDLEMPDPQKIYKSFPYELSGGMKQRIMIAMALACKPKLLIADEPTTALDVTVQSQILDLIKNLQKEYGMALILVTHDLGIVSDLIQDLAVMYAGQIVERGPSNIILKAPKHPYTLGLIRSIPRIDSHQSRLNIIPGRVPLPIEYPQGCRFHTRCDLQEESCERLAYRLEGDEQQKTNCQFSDRVGEQTYIES